MEVRLRTMESVLSGLSSEAIVDAARRFTSGDVQGQNLRFAPSIPEFVKEARRRQEAINISRLPKVERIEQIEPEPLLPEDRERMSFKMAVLSEGFRRGDVDAVQQANEAGMEAMSELAQRWGVERGAVKKAD